MSVVREKVQGTRFCEEAHHDKAHREGGRGEERGQLLQQLPEGERLVFLLISINEHC